MTAQAHTARLLWSLVRFRPRLFLAEAGIWLVLFGVPLLTGLVLKAVFDALTGDEPAGFDVAALLALFVGLETAGVLMTYGRIVVENSIMFNVGALLRTNMLDAVLARPGAEHLPQPTGELVNRFRDDAGEIMGYIWWPAIFVGQAAFAIVAVAIMLRIDALMTAVVLLPLLAVVVIAQLATARLQHYRRQSRTATGGVTGFLGEAFGAVQAIQVAGAERHAAAHFAALNEQRRRDTVRDRVFSKLIDSLWAHSGLLGIGAMLLLAAGAMRRNDFTIGEFALFAYYVEWLRTIPLLVGTLIARYRQAGVAFERLAGVVDETGVEGVVAHRPVHLDGEPPDAPPLQRDGARALRRLEARGLTYRYPPGGGVEDVSIVLERGTVTVVTGRVGAGKTTLLRVLLGLLPRQGGELLWNGERVEDPSAFLVPPRAAYVPQALRLFSTTIRENILLGLREENVDLAAALHAAVLEPDLATMPDGLETVVGPRGVRLSGGQVQRVAAARMFVREPDLVVLDDLSSMLDVETETLLWRRVLERGRTVLAVSHRRVALRTAGRVVVLDRGRVAAEGTLADVLAASPEMRELWEDEP